MLDFLGTVLFGAAIGVLFAAVAGAAPIRPGSRLAFGAAFGAWVSSAATIAAAGKLAELPVLLGLFMLPLFVTAVLTLAVPAVRAAILGIPAPLIIGLNALRVLGVMFLILASAGRLGGPFPYFAGIGDILTGIFAIPTALLAARGSLGNARIVAWNVFGALDLVVAVGLGVTSANGSAIQLIHAGAGSAAITSLPWALVPLVLVPLFLIGHAIVFAQIRAQARSREDRNVRGSAMPPGWMTT